MPDRETILRRFEEWLDQALAAEEPPSGIPGEILAGAGPAEGVDFYSTQAALTALTQEIKLQGRSFKQLSEAVGPVAEMAPALDEIVGEARLAAEERARGDVLESLLDLRDRLARGSQAARQAAASMDGEGWLARVLGRGGEHARETVAALRHGYELTASRLDELLERFDVRETECLGRPFDPRTMHAIAIEETTQVPEGTVVEVFRLGYERDGRVYRAADVKVARPAGRNEDNR